jgi:hypothetical protein
VLSGALDGAPVSEADGWVLDWLAGWDATTVATVAAIIRSARCHPASLYPICARDSISGRPPVQLPPSIIAPGGGPAPGGADLAREVAALAALLVDVVQLAGQRAVFPGRWALIAELALEHDSVRAALRAEGTDSAALNTDPPPSTEHIIAQLNSLHDLIGDDGHARC